MNIIKNEEITIYAPAKINLTLDVTGVLPNGYHELAMVMQTVDVKDKLIIKKTEGKGVEFSMNKTLPDNLPPEKNIVVKAYNLLKDTLNLRTGLSIYLEKCIPAAAGLAGGSTDCAATLIGINSLLDLKLSEEELCEFAVKLGADVPFCVSKGTKLCEGIGEKMTSLPSLAGLDIVLITPTVAVPTQGIYQKYDSIEKVTHPDTASMLSAIRVYEDKTQRGAALKSIAENLSNVLEYVTIPENPIIDTLKAEMIKLGALGSLMSGSGPSVFGIFEDESKAARASETLKLRYPDYACFKTKAID